MMDLQKRIQQLIIERSRLLVALLWVFWIVDMGKFLVDARPLLWLALLGGGLLAALTVLVYRTTQAQLSMYTTVVLLYFYAALIMQHSPSIVNYLFVWVALLLSAYYQEYGPILLAGVLTAIYQGRMFVVYRSLIFPGARPVDLIYPLLFCFFITAFLLYLTRFTKRLWLSAETAEQQLRYVLNNVDVVTWSQPSFDQAPQYSSGVQEIAGVTAEELRTSPKRWLELIHPDDAEVIGRLAERVRAGESGEYEFRFQRPDGQLRWVQARVVPMFGIGGAVLGMQGVLLDITKSRRLEEQIRFLAYNDQLTGLPNRSAFLQAARESLAVAASAGGRRSILFIDLDGFKQVNDSAGHEIGDQVLALIASRLRQALGSAHAICRLGGDEFAVLLNVTHPDQAIFLSEQIIEQITLPITCGNHEFYVGCSIGISHYPEDGKDVELLLRNADLAMYEAKEDETRSRWQVYRPA